MTQAEYMRQCRRLNSAKRLGEEWGVRTTLLELPGHAGKVWHPHASESYGILSGRLGRWLLVYRTPSDLHLITAESRQELESVFADHLNKNLPTKIFGVFDLDAGTPHTVRLSAEIIDGG
jgi:hypothetical protein